MSSVTVLKHNIINNRCLVIFNKSCLKRLKLSAMNTVHCILVKNTEVKWPEITLNIDPTYLRNQSDCW